MKSIETYLLAVNTTLNTTPIEGVRAVYVIGSAVIGSFVEHFSDIDLMIFVDDVDVNTITDIFEGFTQKLPILSCHVHLPEETPPSNLMIVSRIVQEGRLIYGEDIRSEWDTIDPVQLRSQLAIQTEYQLITIRYLLSNAAKRRNNQNKILYFMRKMYIDGMRMTCLLGGMPIGNYDVMLLNISNNKILSNVNIAQNLEYIKSMIDQDILMDAHGIKSMLRNLHVFFMHIQSQAQNRPKSLVE